MTHLVNVTHGGGSFRARAGQTLLDAALQGGVDMPHDCRAGHCGTCRCSVVSGALVGGETESANSVLACQARLITDVTIGVEETPPVETISGRLRSLERISFDVIEAVIDTRRPLDILPGQYCQFRFAGFPGRCYSPTAPLAGPADRNAIRLHIRHVPHGKISRALGAAIKPGHKLKIDGPYGSAYLRAGKTQRLVLVANGTGFAPIWSIALAAVAEMPDRDIVAVVGARTREAFYMAPALKRLVAFPKVQVVPVLQRGDMRSRVVRIGATVDFVPRLAPDDIVYAAGGAGMVRAVSEVARTAGASCYADPFAPAESPRASAGDDLANFAARMLRRVLPGALKQTA